MNIKITTKAYIFVLIFFVVSGFFWNYYYLFDLFSHFYLQLFVATCVLLIWYIWRRYWISSLLTLFLWLFLFLELSGSDFSGIYADSIIKNPDMFYMNAEYINNDITRITDYIRQVQPKQIAMVELNKELFEKVKKEWWFKYSYYYPNNVFSFGFFTNEEVLEQKTSFSGPYPIGYFRTKNKDYYIVHPLPPFTNEMYNLQKTFFTDTEKLIGNNNNFVLIGDFNSSTYSWVFKSHFWKYVYEPIYSWWVNTPLTIPIDYAISNKKLDIHPGAKLSSDHIPLLINF